MYLYIGDLHFGHANCINFDHRPFADRDEMDATMIKLWNSRVSADDDVIIVGDFCFKSGKSPDWYLRQLKGHKHLVIGNHDQVTLECANAAKYLESVEKMMHVADNGRQITLCHFPVAEWNKAKNGSWHIYGHIHANRAAAYWYMRWQDRALNAAACINNYMPVTFDELKRNNDFFKEQHKDEDIVFIAKNKETGEEFAVGPSDIAGFDIRMPRIDDGNIPRITKEQMREMGREH